MYNYVEYVGGLRLMFWGFFKKIVIVDNFGVLVDQVFGFGYYSGFLIIFGMVCFVLQIYVDFFGYFDIVIGMVWLFGFNLMINFRMFYFVYGFLDFWSCWYISFFIWFCDYVYILLGGNWVVSWKVNCNFFVIFLFFGLWYGVNWIFVVWGGMYGGLLIFEKCFVVILKRYWYWIIVLLMVVVLWLLF